MAWIRACGGGKPPIPDGKTVIPIDDVGTWQKCAGLKTKYASLADILADSVTVQLLVNSDNANDYLARSTSFASTICANQSAMHYMGLNNYCADTLLSDSTWCTAICDSTYFESILNAKVPAMTSNTTPEGTAFAHSVFNNDTSSWGPWRAFNGGGGDWSAGSYGTGYIGYTFVDNVSIYKLYIRNRNDGHNPKNCYLQYQDSNNTWQNVGASFMGVNGPLADKTQNVYHQTKYVGRSWRLYATSSYEGSTDWLIALKALQFYGRKDV